GLFMNRNFDEAGSLVDYLEWGTSGHAQSNIAIRAGEWLEGAFADGISAGHSNIFIGYNLPNIIWRVRESSICNDSDDSLLDNGETHFSFHIVPNPVNTSARISILNSTESTRGEFSVIDVNGQVRMSSLMKVKDGFEYQLNLQALERGIYYLRIMSGEKHHVEKFVKY
ncbi:MAG: T9SS type A sorting domain-containing protein, partial [Bacteroidota bacterium]